MEADEAESFLDEHLATTGTLPCARVYRRPDGRVMTTQCPRAADRRHRRRVAGAFLAVATTVASALYANRPILAPDGPVVVDDRELHAKVHDVDSPQVQLGALIPYDDDDETPPIAPPEQPAPVAVTLRAGKMPLLWSAARR